MNGTGSRGLSRPPCTSGSRGTSRGACSPEVLSEDVELEGNRHADTIVEARRPRLALRVDAEPDPRFAASRELGERAAQKQLAEALSPPGTADAEHGHPAHLEASRAPDPGGDLVVVEHD